MKNVLEKFPTATVTFGPHYQKLGTFKRRHSAFVMAGSVEDGELVTVLFFSFVGCPRMTVNNPDIWLPMYAYILKIRSGGVLIENKLQEHYRVAHC